MNKCLNQSQFMREFNDEHREKFNPLFFYRSDDDIIKELQKVILSCQRYKNFLIKVESFEVKDKYEEILEELRMDEMNRNPKDKDNRYNYISLKDSEIKLLIVNYYIRIYDNNPDNQENSKRLRVLIEVPRIVDKYYFKIFGNIYSSMFQVVDGSTYNNTSSNSKTQSVIFKTMFMSIRLYRYKKHIETVNYGTIPCTFFLSRIFNKPILLMQYLLARFGIYNLTEALKVIDFRISDKYDPEDCKKERYVVKKHNLYLSLPVYIYENDQVAQSLLYTVAMGITKDANMQNVFTREYWIKTLGGSFGNRSVQKGLSILDSLESVYDIPAQSSLRLPYEDKKDIYRVLIWAVREFSPLRQKDIFDIAFKRLRFPEYIAALYGMKVSNGIFRIADFGNLTIDQIIKSINVYPDYLLKQITKDSLINYKNLVGDADALYALKFTYKGISGIGDDSSNKGSSVPPAFRRVHPSHLGRVDLDTSSATDPGLSGMLCPLADIYDNSFSDYQEPNSWREKSDELLKNYRQLMGFKEALEFKQELGYEIDNSRLALIDESMDIIRDLLAPVTVIENELVRGVLYL